MKYEIIKAQFGDKYFVAGTDDEGETTVLKEDMSKSQAANWLKARKCRDVIDELFMVMPGFDMKLLETMDRETLMSMMQSCFEERLAAIHNRDEAIVQLRTDVARGLGAALTR